MGPFCGRPACQVIQTKPGKGVCADAYLKNETLVVGDVHTYPGHIGKREEDCHQTILPRTFRTLIRTPCPFLPSACDALSQSEIVLPLKSQKDGVTVGVLDLDSTVKNTFDDEDKRGLERIVALLKI